MSIRTVTVSNLGTSTIRGYSAGDPVTINGIAFNTTTGITLGTASVNKFSTDVTLAGNSNSSVPTEKAVQGFVNAKIPSQAFIAQALATPNVSGSATVYFALFAPPPLPPPPPPEDPTPITDPIGGESNFTAGTSPTGSLYTVPTVGFYQISVGLNLSGFLGHTSCSLVVDASTAVDQTITSFNPSDGSHSVGGTVVMLLRKTETVKIALTVSGGSNIVNVDSGYLSIVRIY